MNAKFWHRFSTIILTFFFVLATQKVVSTYFPSELLNNICVVIITAAWFVFCATDSFEN